MAKQPYRMTKLADIRPYEHNPRIITQAAVDAVARSIQAFGFRQPIIVDGNGVILAGHTRYKAAQQLGLTEVPVVWQTDITDLQARGYRIADNKTAEISAWDRDALDDEVRQIAAQYGDFDVKDLGLSDWEIQRILNDADEVVQAQSEHSGQNQAQESARHDTAPTFGEAPDTMADADDVQATSSRPSICPYCGQEIKEHDGL